MLGHEGLDVTYGFCLLDSGVIGEHGDQNCDGWMVWQKNWHFLVLATEEREPNIEGNGRKGIKEAKAQGGLLSCCWCRRIMSF